MGLGRLRVVLLLFTAAAVGFGVLWWDDADSEECPDRALESSRYANTPLPERRQPEEEAATPEHDRQEAVERSPPDSGPLVREVEGSQRPDAVSGTNTVDPEKTPWAVARGWKSQVLQVRDAGLRADAIRSVFSALQSRDGDRIRAGLLTITLIARAQYDRRTAHDLVLPLLEHSSPEIRRLAVEAIRRTVREPADLETALRLAEDSDKEVRVAALRSIAFYADRDLTPPRLSRVVMGFLGSDQELRPDDHVLRAISYAAVDERVERRLLELAQLPRLTDTVVSRVLVNLPRKSPAVVELLLGVLEDEEQSLHHQAVISGLRQGVSSESRGAVADAFARLLETRVQVPSQSMSLRMILRYGTARQIPSLRRFAANPMVPESRREVATKVIAELESR
jgi:hypothetical protein